MYMFYIKNRNTSTYINLEIVLGGYKKWKYLDITAFISDIILILWKTVVCRKKQTKNKKVKPKAYRYSSQPLFLSIRLHIGDVSLCLSKY